LRGEDNNLTKQCAFAERFGCRANAAAFGNEKSLAIYSNRPAFETADSSTTQVFKTTHEQKPIL
jgi:hypothetical protein